MHSQTTLTESSEGGYFGASLKVMRVPSLKGTLMRVGRHRLTF